MQELELWGGVECTINRVGGRQLDQLRRNGHLTRPSDVDAFAELGIKTLRVPVLWERAMPSRYRAPCFSDFSPMLERVRAHGIRAIAGLVHHGSGPLWTSLVSPDFADEVAYYAHEVACAFPWIEDFTPINEPLTTARFSCLYGHWFPHARDTRSMLVALLNEIRATVRAMAAIRRVIPNARLVQTEDIGAVSATSELAYQADYENTRRFLSLDLLHGLVDRQHPWHRALLEAGASEAELAAWVDEPCVPDVTGINYYFTSDRHLDTRMELYAPEFHGGNGTHRYADVASADAPGQRLRGHREVLESVWQRYRRPVAFTEVHAGCTREEQLRWLDEAWSAATAARAQGLDVRAVTVWALLGSFDWNTLVIRESNHYEPGAFDLRSEPPRPTAIAHMIRGLSAQGRFDHPTLGSPGWWRRRTPDPDSKDVCGRSPRRRAPILITGANGTLGKALARACAERGLPYVALERAQLDITDPEHVRRAVEALSPWAVVNAAGYVRVDDAQSDWERCFRDNAVGPRNLAQACERLGVRLVSFSSDLVFDGRQRTPYLESDAVAPLSVYGHSKAAGERVLEVHPLALVVRTSAFFGPWDSANFVTRALSALRQRRPIPASDEVVSPTYVPHLVNATLDLLIDGESGLWHLASAGAVSWTDLVREVARLARLEAQLIEPRAVRRAPRPAYSVLGSKRGSLMPALEHALALYFREASVA